MNSSLQIRLILFSVIFFLIISWSVMKKAVQFKHSLIWYLTALVFIAISIFPSSLDVVSGWFGIVEPTNSVFLIIIAFLLLIVFSNSMSLSKNQEDITLLIQEISILREEVKRQTQLSQTGHSENPIVAEEVAQQEDNHEN